MNDSPLDQLISPSAGWLSPTSVRTLLDWRVDGNLQSRIEELGTKANLGSITEQESQEYRDYLDDAEIISLIQAKARRNFSRTED